MVDGLLQSKLHVPHARRALVPRPRLTDEVEEARDASLVLVSAPAGFGKTTLLASVAGDGTAVGWVSLDARDGDPTRFWTYVLHALEAASPGCAAAALGLLESGRTVIEDVVASLVNEVSVRADEVTLVLDDYHLAETAEVGASVAFLVEHRPPQLRLILGTRSDPALPLPRLRARGELVELRATDLRFTAEEAGAYLNTVHDLRLPESDVTALEARTEGWAAALQLAALSLRGREDATSFIASFAGDDRFVMDYLVDEVLDQQPDDLRRFLLDTSVLERLSGPLCDAVTGALGGAAALETLERRNLLVVPLDDQRHWYRYHHLFGDVLGSRLLAERPDDVPVLHGRASDWFEQAGDVEAAIRHAFVAGDVDRAADLIEDAAPGLRRQRAERTLRGWVPLVAAEVLVRRPVLASAFVGALMASNVYDGVEARLNAVEHALAAPADSLVIRDRVEWERLPAVTATHRAGLALVSGDVSATIRHADDALSKAADDDQLSVASASALKGLASWSAGDLDSALAAYRTATDGLAAVGHVSDALGCTVTVVDLELQQGRLDAAQRAAERALTLAASVDAVRGVADMWLALGRVAWERGDATSTADFLSRSADLGDAAGLPQQPYRWRVAMSRLREARGDVDGADAMLAEAERVYNSDFSPTVRPVAAVRARLQIRTGNLAAARTWARAADVTATDDPTYLREYEHLTLARLLLAEHTTSGDEAHLAQALTLLERLHGAAASAGRVGTTVETAILLAVAFDLNGQPDEALDWLDQAATLAGPHAWVRPFIDEGSRVQELAANLRGPARAEFARSIAAAAAPAPAGAPGTSGLVAPGPEQTLVVPLSARELDVLRLLSSDLDGPAIARHLSVSLATVRTHTQRIYSKLGVNNRRAAVRRGHQLNL